MVYGAPPDRLSRSVGAFQNALGGLQNLKEPFASSCLDSAPCRQEETAAERLGLLVWGRQSPSREELASWMELCWRDAAIHQEGEVQSERLEAICLLCEGGAVDRRREIHLVRVSRMKRLMKEKDRRNPPTDGSLPCLFGERSDAQKARIVSRLA